MADQSTIQSLLQSGVNLQSNAQNALPFTPNNGNPGTIYNLGAPNVRQFNPATGNLPPMGDAFGNWAVPQGLDPRLLAILGNRVQQQSVIPTIPGGTLIPPVVIPGLPNSTPPPTPTPGNPPPQNGGNQPPQQGVLGGNGATGGAPNSSQNVLGRGWNEFFTGYTTSGGGSPYGNLGGGSYGSGSFGGFNQGGGAPGIYGWAPVLGAELGFNKDGSMDWQQIVDLLTEPFISGDLYNAQTDTWNFGNIGEGVLGGPFGLANQLLNDLFNPDAAKNQAAKHALASISKSTNQTREDTLNWLKANAMNIDVGQDGQRGNFGNNVSSLQGIAGAGGYGSNTAFKGLGGIDTPVIAGAGNQGNLASGGIFGGGSGNFGSPGSYVSSGGGLVGRGGAGVVSGDAARAVAAAMGIGAAASAGRPSAAAINDAMSQNRKNRV